MAMTEQQRAWTAGLLKGAGRSFPPPQPGGGMRQGGVPGEGKEGASGGPVGDPGPSAPVAPDASAANVLPGPGAPAASERSLTDAEERYATTIFKGSLNYRVIRLTRGNVASTGASRTIGNTIHLQDGLIEHGSFELTQQGMQTLVHEMTHVWQFQNQGWGYAPGALWAQFKAWLLTGDRNNAYDWETPARAGTPWDQWNPEAQAEGVEAYNIALRTAQDAAAKGQAAAPACYERLDLLRPYIDGMAAGPPDHDKGDFNPLVGEPEKAGREALEAAAKLAAKAVETVEHAVEKAVDTAKEKGKAVVETVEHAAEKVGEVANEAEQAVVETAQAAVEKATELKDAAVEVAEKAGEAVGGAVDTATSAVSSAADAVSDAASNAFNSLFGSDKKDE